MRSSIIFASLLSISLASADSHAQKASHPKISHEELAKIVASPMAAESIPTSTVEEQGLVTPVTVSDTDTLVLEPPPIFDPPEPRPDTLFDPAGLSASDVLRPPPIPEHRMEHMSPFDGAKAHPDSTPFPSGHDEDAWTGCTGVVKLGGVGLMVMVVGMLMIWMVGRIIKGCVRVVRKRRGTIRLEETLLGEDGAGDIEKGGVLVLGPSREVLARSRSGSKGVLS